MEECRSVLVVANAIPEIERACLWLAGFTGRARIAPDITSRLQIVLDEILSNIFIHAFLDVKEGERRVALAVCRLAEHIELEVIDDGPAFDPTALAVDDSAAQIGERRLGGVGLLFVRKLMDEVRFSRDEGRNRLILTLRLPEI